jgi:hypothetical protein
VRPVSNTQTAGNEGDASVGRQSKAPSAGSNERQIGDRGHKRIAASSRRNGAVTALAALAALIVLAVASPAQAAQTYGFLGAFCEPTGLDTSPCEPSFDVPAGMAVDPSNVDPSNGDVLVIDLEDQTLSRWHEDGTPANFSALSGNVIDGHAGGADETPQEEILLTEAEAAAEVQVAVAPPGAIGGTEGDIYVTDAYNGVIDVFDSSGEYLGQESFGFPCGVAVDPAGNVYVGSFEAEEGVYKLVPSAPATFTESPNSPFEASTPCQVAAGAGPTAGFVFATAYGGPIAKIDSEGPEEGETQYEVSEVANRTVTVDPVTGHVYAAPGEIFLATGSEVKEYDASGSSEATTLTTIELGSPVQGIAVDGDTDHVYIARAGSENVEVFGPPAPPQVTIGEPEDVTATKATFTGTVDPDGFATEWHFEYRKFGTATWTSSPTRDAGSGDAPVPVSFEATGLASGAAYEVRLLATNAGGTDVSDPPNPIFATETGPPTIVQQLPLNATQTSVTLQARIDPNGLPTSYHFEFGADTSYGTRIPADHELFAGSGTDPLTVTAFRNGLQEKSVYYFRLVATNAKGTTVGPDQRLETLNENNLPNNRGFELVTPAVKGTAGSLADLVSHQQFTQAASDGGSFMYPLQNGIESSTAGGWLRELASRTESGWLSTQISGPALIPPPRDEILLPSKLKYIAPDNSCGFLESYNPLDPGTPQTSIELGITNLYRWNAADGGYELVTDRLPLNPQLRSGSYYDEVIGSDDCSRVYFTSKYELIVGASGLYEWDEGTLRDAGILPDGVVGADALPLIGSVSARAVFGGEVDLGLNAATGRRNAVSLDGSRLFFTALSDEGPDSGRPAVFVREDAAETTDPACVPPLPNSTRCAVDVSQSQTAVPTKGARYEAASPDGSRVFFRANYGIAASSSSGPTGQACGPLGSETESDSSPELEQRFCDLYAYDTENGQLTDLSADAADPNGAQIQGTVAVDADGSHVYFAALGQLIPGKGRTYAQNVAGFGSANVYLAHGGQLAYVTTLVEHGPALGDGGDLLGRGTGGADLMRRIKWVANTTPDGGKLLFISASNLTGYDSGGLDGYEAYLYSAATGGLDCVSCRPDGLPSVGASHPLQVPDEDHRPPSISEDGSQVFFTSPNVLAPGAVSGQQNVYEWQQGQVFFLANAEGAGLNGISGYRDMSLSGDDVFIATGERLAPQDTDSLSDVYDLRVASPGFPVESKPPPCQVAESIPLEANQVYCQGDRTPQPASSSPASAGFSGAGNPPQTNPHPKRCPKGKVRRHGRCVRKHSGHRRKHGHKRAASANRGGVK